MSQSDWVWDPSRGSYLKWLEHENVYLCEDGTKLTPTSSSPEIPNHQPRNNTIPHALQSFQDSSTAVRRDSSSTGDLSPYFSSLSITGDQQSGYTHQQPSSSYIPNNTNVAPVVSTFQPQATSPPVNQSQFSNPKVIRGTSGYEEALDSKFHIRTKPRDFYRVGKVIKILWPELIGNNAGEGTTVISDTKFKTEKIITKIRWFVVVREGHGSCTCVPISTYNGRGCSKPGVAKWQHSIVYTDKKEPDMLAGEEPEEGEHPMLGSIRVVPASKGDKMFPASRIHYGKVYTVEHNVKVYNFGDVHRGSLTLLHTQWDWVFNQNGRASTKLQPETPVVPLNAPLPILTENTIVNPEPAVDYQTLPVHGTAIFPREDTTDGYLLFQKDDRIYAISYQGENWVKGRNESSGHIGLFPRQGYVTFDSPDYATALKDNEYDKKKPDRLVFKKNDRILVKGFLSVNWDMGYNTRTGEEGRYAHQWVRMDRGHFATAIYDYPYDESKPGHLVFKAKDRILVTEGDTTQWARGRNEATRQEGKFPGNYVKFNE